MTSLTIVRRIPARPSIVFDAVSTADGIAQWWGPDAGPVLLAEVDLRVGGAFRVRFRMLDGSEHECRGTYLVVERPSRIVSTWQWLGDESEGTSQIEIVVRPVEDATELTFTHSRLADEDERRGHEKGWNGSFDKLERFLSRRPNDSGASR